MTIREIRKSFLDFFEQRGHKVMPSASLLPANDPTLLFTTAGMVPFKPYFAGTEKPPAPRLASVQKCLRTTDLEETGKTARHLTFFEMLGNFSFGDYFKKEAIEYAWEYSTKVLPFQPDQIWISVYEEDDEAYALWRDEIGIPEERIVRLGKEDNFWGPAGDSGACGPCSELYLDRGKEYGCQRADCKPGCDCDRFMEYWNLVFNQYNQTPDGKLEPLPQTGIDTGAGLERLAALVQKVDSVYDTDELKKLLEKVCEVYSTEYEGEKKAPIRVLTDHIRTLTFAISDGIFPSNEGRGYVLRRVLRRALLFGRKLGQKEEKLYRLVDTVVEIYGYFYPELLNARETVRDYVKAEESRFLKTLESGASRLEEILKNAKGEVSGKDAFILYDTYGFPVEMTKELAEARGLSLNEKEFEEEMQKQRERAKQAAASAMFSIPPLKPAETQFTGYESLEEKAKIIHLYDEKGEIQEAKEGDYPIFIVMNKTPFYGESGGQLGDTGVMESEYAQVEIYDTQKQGEVIVHIGKVVKGKIQVGEELTLRVDKARREALMKNHSATHLLNAALRKKFGDHIRQSGSLVHPAYLRFDFTHNKALTKQEIEEIENQVNEWIEQKIPVQTAVLPKEEAVKKGAVMTFGEKYGDVVRVVQMGDASSEFCGGTHVSNTAEIASFVILKEGSPGAGNRRIEAVTAQEAINKLEERKKDFLSRIAQLEKIATAEFNQKIQALKKDLPEGKLHSAREIAALWEKYRDYHEKLTELEREIRKSAKKKKQTGVLTKEEEQSLVDQAKHSKQSVLLFVQEGWTIPAMKKAADILRSARADAIYILAGYHDTGFQVVMATTKNYAVNKNLDFSSLIREWMQKAPGKGGGGGKKELAQASAKWDKPRVEELKNWLNSLVEKIK
ncbi:MAG: alanine--tRNA ligase [Candidatus Hydrogenedentota bacterium]|nr:MAG: alanine--tRNA ligase [Candidatus Hydrogenedentota bacterium]